MRRMVGEKFVAGEVEDALLGEDLRPGVERDGVEGRVLVEDVVRPAVDAAGRGEDEAADAVELAGEGQRLGGEDVGFDRLLGPVLGGRVADDGGEEDDRVDVLEGIDDGLDVAEVALDDLQVPVAFERRGAISGRR